MTFEIYQASDGWRWRLRAANGRITANGGEAFVSKSNAERSVETVVADLQHGDRYFEAKALVLGAQKASASLLQRKLYIGYNQAARLIERMEEEGFVGPANNVGRRDVLGTDLGYRQ